MASLVGSLGPKGHAVFAAVDGTAGFPFLLRVAVLAVVEDQLREKRFSLQALARALQAKLIRLPRRRERELFNINTPDDWERARRLGAAEPSGRRPSPVPMPGHEPYSGRDIALRCPARVVAAEWPRSCAFRKNLRTRRLSWPWSAVSVSACLCV